MAVLINYAKQTNNKPKSPKSDCNYFRHHDVGDIQSLQHLRNIVSVCHKTQKVNHWISTHEVDIVTSYLSTYGSFPDNLTVRISADMINQRPKFIQDLPIATVSTSEKNPIGSIRCPAKKNNNTCGPCRACWSRKVNWVDYLKH